MILNKLETLKIKLRDASDFEEAWTYFFEHCSVNEQLLDHAKPIEDEDLSEMINVIGNSLLDEQSHIGHIMFLEVSSHDFVYGLAEIDGVSGTVAILYFRDLDKGILGVMVEDDFKLARFTNVKLNKHAYLINPDNKSVH